MIERDDLRAAVAAGILTEAQAASVTSLAHKRNGARVGLSVGDEPFELFKGFNEIFIVVGLGILAAGYAAVVGVIVSSSIGGWIDQITISAAIGAGLIWLLSEYFIRRRRMIAPAIALSVLWAINAGVGFGAQFTEIFMLAQRDTSSLPLPQALTTAAILVHWFRFRVPFSLALVALGAFTVAIVLAASTAGIPQDIRDVFLLSAGGPFAWITLALGVVVFGIAMAFDMSDPHRVTRRAANGFWLHVVAAPALVNTLALTLLEQGSNAVLFVVLMFFAIVAIVIDRRSFLITAVGYSVALSFIVFESEGGAFTVLGLGVILVLLGAFWERLRAHLLRLLAPLVPLNNLPPSVISHD